MIKKRSLPIFKIKHSLIAGIAGFITGMLLSYIVWRLR
ncbi:hypothetical protein J2Z51_001109 [Enterococcus alcedinis]|nr:hypothetical protein [Enterococcus alcedinis]